MAVQMYTEHLKYLDLPRKLSPVPHEGTDAVASHVQQRLKTLGEMRARSGESDSFNTTEMVRWPPWRRLRPGP